MCRICNKNIIYITNYMWHSLQNGIHSSLKYSWSRSNSKWQPCIMVQALVCVDYNQLAHLTTFVDTLPSGQFLWKLSHQSNMSSGHLALVVGTDPHWGRDWSYNFKIPINSNRTITFRDRNYGCSPFTIFSLITMPASSNLFSSLPTDSFMANGTGLCLQNFGLAPPFKCRRGTSMIYLIL